MPITENPTSFEIKQLAADPIRFGELTESHRRELQVHCYRILGSIHEAEDMAQETFVKAWKRIDSYEGRASFRAWLYKIATNTCLDFLDSKRSRRLLPPQQAPASDPHTILPPAAEATWLEPIPDSMLEDFNAIDPEAHYTESESISLAFLTALQILPPRQRAVLILRDVLDFSAIESADVLEITVSSVNSLLHRARQSLKENYQSSQSSRLTDEKTQWLLERYVRAWRQADVDSLVALLRWDAVVAMPPSPSWYRGRKAIAEFSTFSYFGADGMFTGKPKDRWQLLPTHSNGSPAFAIYVRDEINRYQAFGIQVLIIQRDKIAQIINFIDPTLPERFGLPAAF